MAPFQGVSWSITIFYILVEAILLFSGSKIGYKITKNYKIIIYKSEVVKLQISELKFNFFL